MGISPLHTSTVSLVRNLSTNTLSPQFHVIHDDNFETVHTTADKPSDNWEELSIRHSFHSDLDTDEYDVDLAKEWLNAEELEEKRNTHKQTTIDIPLRYKQNKEKLPGLMTSQNPLETSTKEETKQRVENIEIGPSTSNEQKAVKEESKQIKQGSLSPSRSGRSKREPVRYKFDK